MQILVVVLVIVVFYVFFKVAPSIIRETRGLITVSLLLWKCFGEVVIVITGLGLCVWIWIKGHDNLGLVVLLTSFAFAYASRRLMSWMIPPSPGGGCSSSWTEGMKRIYDTEGNVTHYEER